MEAAAEASERPATAPRLLVRGTAALTAAGVSTARLDAEVLLATAGGVDRTALYRRINQPLAPALQQTFCALLERRLRREPLQYIVGRQEFWSLDFGVTRDVLIPRPETELLVELTIAIASAERRREPLDTAPEKMGPARDERRSSSQRTIQAVAPSSHPLLAASRGAPRPLAICDLGTGSGCVAVALAREVPDADIWAVDQSAAALAVARENARRHGVEHIRFVAGDLFRPVAQTRFDLVVCNPPYVATRMLEQVQPELAWEPRSALDGGADGLDVIRRVIAGAPDHLVGGGWLLMEIGADQGPAVLDLAGAARFEDVSVRDDYAGQPRVLLARR